MEQIKTLKTWGSGLGLYFDSEEVNDAGMKAGDKIDTSDMYLIDKVAMERRKYKKLPKNQTKEMIKKEVLK